MYIHIIQCNDFCCLALVRKGGEPGNEATITDEYYTIGST